MGVAGASAVAEAAAPDPSPEEVEVGFCIGIGADSSACRVRRRLPQAHRRQDSSRDHKFPRPSMHVNITVAERLHAEASRERPARTAGSISGARRFIHVQRICLSGNRCAPTALRVSPFLNCCRVPVGSCGAPPPRLARASIFAPLFLTSAALPQPCCLTTLYRVRKRFATPPLLALRFIFRPPFRTLSHDPLRRPPPCYYS